MNINDKKINDLVELLGSWEFSIEQLYALAFIQNSITGMSYTELGTKLSMSQSSAKQQITNLLSSKGAFGKRPAALIEFVSDKVTYIKTTDYGVQIIEQLSNALPLSYSDVITTKTTIENGLTKLKIDQTQNGFIEFSSFIKQNLNIDKLVSLGIVENKDENNARKVGYAKSFFVHTHSTDEILRREFQIESANKQLISTLRTLLHSKSKVEAVELLNPTKQRMDDECVAREYIANIHAFEKTAGIHFHKVFLDQGANSFFSDLAIDLIEKLKEKCV